MQCVYKIALAIAVHFLLSFAASAQLSYGLEGGPAVTDLSEKGCEESHYSAGFAVPFGIFGDWQFAGNSSINAGLGYMPVCAASFGKHQFLLPASQEHFVTDCVSELRLHYLSIPLRFQYAIPLNEHLSLFAQAGPCLQLLLVAQKRDEGYGKVYSEDGNTVVSERYFHMTKDVTQEYHDWNFSLETNIGLRWKLRDDYGIVKLGRNHGLTNPEKEASNYDHKTNACYLMVGYAVVIPSKKR